MTTFLLKTVEIKKIIMTLTNACDDEKQSLTYIVAGNDNLI